MKMICALILSLAFSSMAFAVNDGSDVPACKGVTDICMGANVTGTDAKKGTMHGYQPGEHAKDGEGLWADCVRPLAQGKTVAGVTGVTQDAARACMKAEKIAHPKKK